MRAAATDVDALIEANYLSGIVACVMGDFMSGRRDLEECIRLYGNEVRESTAFSMAKMRKLPLWDGSPWGFGRLGNPTRRWSARRKLSPWYGIRLNRSCSHAVWRRSGSYMFFAASHKEPDSPLLAALALCGEQGFAYFHAVVSAFQGTNLVHARQDGGRNRTDASEYRVLRTIGSELLFTVIIGNLASALLALARVEEGLAVVDDGLKCVQTNGEHWGEADLHRIRGQLLLIRGIARIRTGRSVLSNSLRSGIASSKRQRISCVRRAA